MNKLDFPDCFLPALVKDLRQSMRATSSLVTLCLVPCLLALTLTAEKSTSFWTVTAVLLFLSSIVAFRSVKQDVGKGNTNFLILTGLTSWRIVLGKWLSVVVQLGLFNLIMVPFAAIASNTYEQPFGLYLIYLAILNAGCIILAAIQMFLAGMPVIYRAAGIVAGITFFMNAMFLCNTIAQSIYDTFCEYNADTIQLLGLGILDGSCIVLLFLLLTRRFYAPASENCFLPLRWLSLVPWSIAAILALCSPQNAWTDGQFFFSALYSAFIVWLDITLPVTVLPGYRAIVRTCPWRIRPAFLSMPGWQAAYVWGIILLLLHGVLLYTILQASASTTGATNHLLGFWMGSAPPELHFYGVILVTLTILYNISLPLVIINFFRKNLKDTTPLAYVIVQIALGMLGASMLDSPSATSAVLAWVPGFNFASTFFEYYTASEAGHPNYASAYFLNLFAATAIACVLLAAQAWASSTKTSETPSR